MSPDFSMGSPAWQGWSYPGYNPPANGFDFAKLFGGDMKGPLAGFAMSMAQQHLFPQQGQAMQPAQPVQMFSGQHSMQPALMPNLYQPRPMGRLYG